MPIKMLSRKRRVRRQLRQYKRQRPGVLARAADVVEGSTGFRLLRIFEVAAVFAALVAFAFDYQQRSIDRGVRIATLHAQIAQTLEMSGGDRAVRASVRALYQEGVSLSELFLVGADLSFMDLSGVDLSGADLAGANLRGTNLSKANLSNAVFAEAVIDGALLANANLASASLQGARLLGANLTGANLSNADARGASFADADLSFTDLLRADFRDASLRGYTADNCGDGVCEIVSSVSLRGASLYQTSLNGADLFAADFTGATLRFVWFGDVDVTGVRFPVTVDDPAGFADDLADACFRFADYPPKLPENVQLEVPKC